MKTQQGKRKIIKLLLYILLCYFISTWGVNQTANPLTYVKKLSAQVIPVQPSSDEAFLKITIDNTEKYPYLWMNITESDRFFQTLPVQTENDSISSIEISKGMNCLDLYSLGGSILISQEDLAKNGTVLSDISASSAKFVNIRKTLSTFASFLFFSVCWESVQWVKKRYTQ